MYKNHSPKSSKKKSLLYSQKDRRHKSLIRCPTADLINQNETITDNIK